MTFREEDSSRYIIGIDLGTTNCALAYVDTDPEKNPSGSASVFSVPQLFQAGVFKSLPTLPSFLYLAEKDEFPSGSLSHPWRKNPDYFVGHLAREQGARIPSRVINSAKSWLCHGGADRSGKILPPSSPEERKMSPVAASAAYLRHLADAWNQKKAKGRAEEVFEEQDIILTVPASFDEIARRLTLEAARSAGLQKITLLEEPQAAFYSWIMSHEKTWEKNLNNGDSILVVDVGGGTTDFSLIEVEEKSGKKSFQRSAVGQHLLLGGDNMDRALCHQLEQKLGSGSLSTDRWMRLNHQARKIKEEILEDEGLEQCTLLLEGEGSSVVGGSQSLQLDAASLRNFLREGFFPKVELSQCENIHGGSALKTMGLPYESEAAITKHLGSFLSQNKAQPSHLLFNGGSMKPGLFQRAILDNLQAWSSQSPQVLDSESLDLAVSRGAAYFGKVRRGHGTRIGGGSPRAYYLRVDLEGESTAKALTLMARGSEEGSHYTCPEVFHARPNRPIMFEILTSHTRLGDKAGDIIGIDPEECQGLPPLQTILKFGKGGMFQGEENVPVRLNAYLSEIGTISLNLNALQGPQKWELDFQVRSASGGEGNQKSAGPDLTFDKEFIESTAAVLDLCFSPNGEIKPSALFKHLEENLSQERSEWPPSVLRALWDHLINLKDHRKISKEHESRWWNLAGYLLRPGFAYALDEFRIKELWKVFLQDSGGKKAESIELAMFICLRRIAGGLSRGQQGQVVHNLLPQITNKKRTRIEGSKGLNPYALSERIRTLAAMELMELPLKGKLGDAILASLEEEKDPSARFWALGRMGARNLFYGAATHVLSPERVEPWIRHLLSLEDRLGSQGHFALALLSQKSDHREIDIPETLRDEVLRFFDKVEDGKSFREIVLHDRKLSKHEEEKVFGEELPAGLVLSNSASLEK